MTKNTPEILWFEGTSYRLCTRPFDDFLAEELNEDEYDKLCKQCGITIEWKISGDSLFYCWSTASEMTASSHVVSPEFLQTMNQWMAAEWFTGTLRCPHGERLSEAADSAYESHEYDLYLVIHRGVLIDHQIFKNVG